MAIFEHVKNYLDQGRPFVIFREPTSRKSDTHHVRMYAQKDQKINTTREYWESGFVMAPFDVNSQPSILFPRTVCDFYEAFIPPGDLDFNKSSRTDYPGTQTQTQTQHLHLVSKGIKAIKAGRFKKVVLSRSIFHPAEAAPEILFQRLLIRYSRAFVYLWHHPKIGTWLGATPETLLQLEGTHFKTMALASTQVFEEGKQPQWTAKEIEEQDYVSQFIKDRLSPYSRRLKITGPNNARAGKLWHLKSKIEGVLKTPDNLNEVLNRLHPTPAVCGFPKEKAKAFILKNENHQRLFYSGFLGMLNVPFATQKAETSKYTRLYVNLRCMQFHSENLQLYVGGGIVKGSIPEQEWQETVNKSQTLLEIL